MHLVCTGALTNAALLLILYPEVACMIEITIMGGCLGIGAHCHLSPAEMQLSISRSYVLYALEELQRSLVSKP